MWFTKVITLKGQGHRLQIWHYWIPWPKKNISRLRNCQPIKCLSAKLWSTTSFCIMVANITHSRMSQFQTNQDGFDLLKGPDPSYPMLKFGDNLSSSNWDMAQNVILQVCDLERSRSSMKANKFSIRPHHLHISTRVKFYWNLITSFSVTMSHSLTEKWPGERRKKKERIWWKQVDTFTLPKRPVKLLP